MSSLQEHLVHHDLAETGVAFRRDCPVCRGERVLGQLPSTALVSPRACAAVTALALVTSTSAPGSVLADGQGVAVPAPPSPPPPSANVQAAGGGAAPADTGLAPAGAPAVSEHDDAAARHDGPPGGTAPAPSPGGPSGMAESVTGSSAPPAATHPATGGDSAAGDPPPATTDGGLDAASEDGDDGSSVAPAPGGTAVAPAAAAAPAPPPTASTPTPTTWQATTGRPTASTSSPAGHHPVHDRGSGHPDIASAPARPDAKTQSRSGPRAQAGHGGEPHSGTGSRTGSVRSEATNDKSAPTAAKSSSSTRHQPVEVQTPGTYRVQPGDSLWRIAARHLGTDATTAQTAREVNRLWELNQQRIGTGNPDLIFPGQTLTM